MTNIVVPQRKALYLAAKKKMMKEKEAMIEEEHTIFVEVKTKKAYTFGGRVEGRRSGPYAGESGTIIDTYIISIRHVLAP